MEDLSHPLSGGQEEFRAMADATAEDHNLWGKIGEDCTHGESQLFPELVEGDARIGVFHRETSEQSYLPLATGTPAVGKANGAGGDGILNRGTIEGKIPNLSAWWNAFSLVDETAIDCKSGAHTCSKRQAN